MLLDAAKARWICMAISCVAPEGLGTSSGNLPNPAGKCSTRTHECVKTW